MTRIEDVRLAGELGVDAIGLVFAPRSRRRLDLAQALMLRGAVPASTAVVALLMDQGHEEIATMIAALRPDLLQFHGDEDDAFCAAFGLPFLKALPMRDIVAQEIPKQLAGYPSACGFVLDGHAAGAPGGSGQRFDWNALRGQTIGKPWLLAGGLHAGNVAQALRATKPWGVDVASGVESAPGVKDHAKMQVFVDAVREARFPLSPTPLPQGERG
ncbi:MAG: phosphoribosylanthranilate isomerase [Proteobacteria bacterium]|nr:phosphoribosylanthranilate isomerase [Pseudomonadota bacterium]